MKPKIDDEDLFEFVKKEGAVTTVQVARRYNVTQNTAGMHLIDLAKQGKMRYVQLPPLPHRLYKKPFNCFRKKRLYFVDADELYRWLQRQVDGVCDRDKKIFFSIIDKWFVEVKNNGFLEGDRCCSYGEDTEKSSWLEEVGEVKEVAAE